MFIWSKTNLMKINLYLTTKFYGSFMYTSKITHNIPFHHTVNKYLSTFRKHKLLKMCFVLRNKGHNKCFHDFRFLFDRQSLCFLKVDKYLFTV
jgi:hypothetical protein